MFLIINDKINGVVSKRYKTNSGYLVCPDSSLARSGILHYTAGSVGIDGYPKDKLLSVYRPAEEVKKIAEQYANMPVTKEHPKELEVTPNNAKGLQVGHIGSNVQVRETADGEVEIIADVIITDAETIKGIENAEARELSAGYRSSCREEKGITRDGVEYQAVQFDLIPNHVAVVEKGRCGVGCRVADSKQTNRKEKKMKPVNVKIGDELFQVTPEFAQAMTAGNGISVVDEKGEETVVAKKAEDMEEENVEGKKAEDEAEENKKKEADGITAATPIAQQPSKAESKEGANKAPEGAPATKEPGKATGDGAMFDITIDGKPAKVDAAALAFITKVSADAKEAKPTVDAMEIAKVTSAAVKIIGDSFDVASYSDPKEIKKEIVKKSLPHVDEAQLVNDVALDALYKLAVDTFEKTTKQFADDFGKLTVGDSNVAGLSKFVQGVPVATEAEGQKVADTKTEDPFDVNKARTNFFKK